MTPIVSSRSPCLRSVAEFAIVALLAGSTLAQTTERVSVSSSGVEGDSHSYTPSITADGRFVVFDSYASNLVAGDTNGFRDVFVHDRATGTTERVSVASGGAEGNSNSYRHSISADGRFVAFWSDGSNLVTGDTNSAGDIFVRDRITGTTERVSVDSNGAEGNSECYYASISADGRWVAFASSSTNLVPGDTNGFWDVFVHDRTTGMTERVSVATSAAQGNNDSNSSSAAITPDGRFVTFESNASNLVAGDTNQAGDIFVRDRQSGTTQRVSVATSGVQGNGLSRYAALSADGRFVAFESDASNFVPSDTNYHVDIFVRDRQSATTERVSVATGGGQANGSSGNPLISADGRFVTFWSAATMLVVGDTNGSSDAFVRDRQSATTERVSVDSSGVQGNGYYSGSPSASADGRFVVFDSGAWNLVVGDTNSSVDVFLRDRGQQLLSVYCTSGTSSNGCIASIAASSHPSVSFANACNITVTHTEGQQSGILFYGIDNAGFVPGSWESSGMSTLCVKSPVQRTPIQNSGGTSSTCTGTYVLDWNAYQSTNPIALGNPWTVGARVYVQAWSRDPFVSTWTNLSDAVEMTYQP